MPRRAPPYTPAGTEIDDTDAANTVDAGALAAERLVLRAAETRAAAEAAA